MVILALRRENIPITKGLLAIEWLGFAHISIIGISKLNSEISNKSLEEGIK